MDNQRVIITASGEPDYKWNYYLGKLKHFIEIENETLIERTIRQAAERTSDIWVVGPDNRYKFDDAYLFVPKRRFDIGGGDCFYQTRDIWSHAKRNVILFGDTWYSEDAIAKILDDTERGYRYYCRPGPSQITGTEYGEGFAVSFYPEDIPEYRRTLDELIVMYKEGKIERFLAWEHYRHMEGQDPNVHAMYTRWVEIDDWTDDFDWPHDYNNWMQRRYQ